MSIEKLKKSINDFMYKNSLNINKARIIIKNGGESPFGIAVNTVYGILAYNRMPRNRKDLFKLLDKIGVNYKKDSLDNVKLLSSRINKVSQKTENEI
jgi:hypothetical protein